VTILLLYLSLSAGGQQASLLTLTVLLLYLSLSAGVIADTDSSAAVSVTS